MRCLLVVLTVLSFFHASFAIPVSGSPSFPFRLKTKLCYGASHLADLWLTAYHTGAGKSDLTLIANRTATPQWTLTTDGILQRARGSAGSSFDWSAKLASSTGYAGWEPVTLEAGEKGSKGFFFDSGEQAPAILSYSTTSLNDRPANATEDPGNQFYSWFVCDWSHGVAQLYWRVKGSVVSPQIPPLPNCAEVKLQVSYELDLKMSLKDKGID